MQAKETAPIDWDEPVEPPLGRGAKPATWDHAKWPERAA